LEALRMQSADVLPWLAFFLASCLALIVLRQFGRALTRLDSIEQELVLLRIRDDPTEPDDETVSQEPSRKGHGLAVGSGAPRFEVERLAGGGLLSSEDFRGRFHTLILVAPGCTACRELIRRLARKSPQWLKYSTCLIIQGASTLKRPFEHLHSYPVPSSIGIEAGTSVSRSYAASTYPAAYVIGTHGLTLGPVFTGLRAVSALIDVLEGMSTQDGRTAKQEVSDEKDERHAGRS
jgi:hypothetical protein